MLFSLAFVHVSATSPRFTGASSYKISSNIWLNFYLPHPRAYACSTSLTDFSVGPLAARLSGNSPRSHSVSHGIVGSFLSCWNDERVRT